MRNITAVPVVWVSVVGAQRVGGLCLQKDGITLSGSVISVLRKRDNFRWTVIFFRMTRSCPIQTVVSNRAWKEILRSLCFWIGAFCWKEKLNIFLTLSEGNSNTCITCLQTVFRPALVVSLVYWAKNTVHCCDWSVKEIWVLKNAISLPSSTIVNPRVGTWFLRTCKAKICQLGPLCTRTRLALNLKQVFLFSKMYKQKSVYLGKWDKSTVRIFLET